jgi:hypothetical protein
MRWGVLDLTFFERSKNRNIRNIRTKLIKPTFLQEHYKNITREIGTLGNCDIMSAIPLATSLRWADPLASANPLLERR